MALYEYTCPIDGVMEVRKPMSEADQEERCPLCHSVMKRVYTVPPIHYRADGFHDTDYGKGRLNHVGDKNDNLNRNWSKATGEKPPPPAPDVPRSGDKF